MTRHQPEAQARGQSVTTLVTGGLPALLLSLPILLWTSLQSPAQEKKADDPEPIRLKRKDKPDEPKPAVKEKDKDEKDKDKEKAKEEPAPAPQEDPKQIMERIGKNMRASEERLKSKDPGDATQQVQRDIVKDLDKLIEQAKNQDQDQQQQQGMGGGGGGSGKSSSKSRSQRASKNQGGGNGSSPQQQEKKGEGTGQQQANNPKDGGGTGTQGGRGSTSPTGPNNVADLHKDIWGHLPEAMRQQMDAYSRETFMLKYQDLLRQYYATIAEKGRKSGEGER